MLTLESHFLALAYNNHWSNHRIHSACASLPDDEYFQSRKSFFGSVHATLEHILLTDLEYLDRLTGQGSVPMAEQTVHGNRRELRQQQYDTDRRLIGFCEGLDTDRLESVMTFKRQDGITYKERVGPMLTHLFIHQIHHRGQVHDMLSATGTPPPQLDEFLLEGDLALREKELRELGLPFI